jgi:hypothetical protein
MEPDAARTEWEIHFEIVGFGRSPCVVIANAFAWQRFDAPGGLARAFASETKPTGIFMTYEHESDLQRVERDQSPTWILRLAMALVGVILLIGAFVAWQMHWMVGGLYGAMLPWVLVLAVLLGAGAIVESIKTGVWMALLFGISLVFAAYVVTGRYVVNLDASSHGVFVVDRFSGETHYCSQNACQTLSEGVSLKKVVTRFETHR